MIQHACPQAQPLQCFRFTREATERESVVPVLDVVIVSAWKAFASASSGSKSPRLALIVNGCFMARITACVNALSSFGYNEVNAILRFAQDRYGHVR